MKTIYSCNGNFRIGRVGENNACEVFIPKEGFADIYGAGVYSLVYDRPDGECYECPVEERSAFIVWTPTAADTAVAGRGHIELVYRAGEVVAKGKIYDILIDISLSAAGEAPETEPEVYVFPAAETADGARLARLCQKTIFIGRVGENKATVANVRKGPEMASYEGAFGLLFQRPGEEAPYLVEAVDKGEYLEWIITNTDTAIPGRGKLQMIYSGNGTVAKGDIYDTMCDVSLDGPGDPPEPWSGYVEEVLEAATKIENMTASASVTRAGETGVVVTKTETGDSYNLDFAFTGIGAETALEMNLNSMTLDDGKIAYLFVAANVASAEELAALNPTLVRLNYYGKYLIFNPPYQKSITGTIRRNAEDWSSYTLDFGELGRINNTGTLSVRIPQAMMSRFTSTNANELTLRTWAQVFSAETQAQMRQNIGAASESDLQDHVDNVNVHVTAADKNIWDAKYSKPTGGIPMNDLSQAVQEAINSESVVELYSIGTVLNDDGVLCYGFSAENTGITAEDLKTMKPTLMRIWWNHNDPALTDGFDRYAVGVLRKMQNQWTAYIVDFGELGRFRATAFPRFYVSKAFFDTYFTATAATVETLHSWAQTFDATKQAQMRANIGAASSTDLQAHTGDTGIHVTAQEKAGWDSKYTLPSGGIPEADLSQDVQTKLNEVTSAAVFVAEASFTDWSTAQTFTLNRTSNELFSILENASDREQGLNGVFYANIDGFLFVEPATLSMMRFLTQRIMVFTIGPAIVPVAVANIVPNDNPMQVVVPATVLQAVFNPQADIDQIVRTIPQSLATSQKVQARTNIDVPSTSDLTNHTGNSTIHVTAADKSSWNAKYTKPSTGIPASDLAADVIPGKTSDLTNDGADGTSTYVEADELATVATSGSYNDLSNKPAIPSKTSDLSNDSDFITETAVDTKLETKADSAGASANYAAKLTASIPYGECDSTSTATVYTATVPGITELKDGVCMLLYNGVVTSASGFTINVNGLGAKPSYNNMTLGNSVTPTNPTRDTTIFNINYAFLFVYSETLVSGGCWIGYRGYDANTNTIGYQLRTNSSTMKTADKFYRYRLLFTSADGAKWIPANTSTSTNATSARTPNTRAIDPFGEIVWYGTTTAIEANANVTAAQLWQEYYGSYTNIGYSFNNTGSAATMTAALPIYIKCTPQADGSAVIDATTPYTQTLPTSADGKIYIYLGRAVSATLFEITMQHPVYYHDGSGIRLWTGKAMPAGLPAVTSADNGKVAQVVNGVWAAATIPNANGVSF